MLYEVITVEGHDDHLFKAFAVQLQQQIGGGQFSGNGDRSAPQLFHGDRLPGDDQRTATATEGAAATQQSIIVAQQAEGMIRNFGEIKGARQCQGVQGFHILQPLLKIQFAEGDTAVDQSIENEGVVGAGRITRITSYNVCYTKLLRIRGRADDKSSLTARTLYN